MLRNGTESHIRGLWANIHPHNPTHLNFLICKMGIIGMNTIGLAHENGIPSLKHWAHIENLHIALNWGIQLLGTSQGNCSKEIIL